MSDSYYVISNSDGEVSIDGPVTRDELTRRIDRRDYGDNPQWLHVMPDDLQTMGSAYVIIRGTVVVPRAVETVTRHELP